MADFQPFQALTCNLDRLRQQPERGAGLADVLTEPYDKITSDMQAAYYARHDRNIVRIILGREEAGDTDQRNKYTRAAEFFRSWRQENFLARRERTAIFAYEQTFRVGGRELTRRALIGRVRLSRPEEGHILPHERTLSKPKADRLNLLRHTQAHFGQIFLLYSGSGEELAPPRAAATLLARFEDSYGIRHCLTAIEDGASLNTVQQTLQPLKFYIADGHHRFETSLNYREEMRRQHPNAGPDAPFEFTMATLVAMDDPGLVVLPTHRLVHNVANFNADALRRALAEWFDLEPAASLDGLQARMAQAPAGDHWFGMFLSATGFTLLKLRRDRDRAPLFAGQPPLWENLDVAILHTVILDRMLGINEERLREESNLHYLREATTGVESIRAGKGQAFFLLNPTPVRAVQAIADARSRMPQKSTDFYPKLPTGMTIYDVSV
ncbi:MAG: hypothetical protein A2107_01800 [Verrucomicrobia bacterium GWF2_62_7]|nr:MAG: hypothetical protein A2107_01800 [Verrucomicrobia bacterium GWF2_62_7]